jgi:hypothetical protein
VGKCNKGFLRDDALLFLTFISDTDDEKSKSTPVDWYKAIVKAKHGDPARSSPSSSRRSTRPKRHPCVRPMATTRTRCAT